MDHGRTQSLPTQQRLSVLHGDARRKTSDVRRKSLVEHAEAAGFDKNTIILAVNLLILCALMAILYVLATSAMNVSSMSGKYALQDEK
uniref:Triple QxxK/R motif-containing protein n=1 Tax=Globodera pallida TaxID=36090 RepID=A0A183C1D6_GLOPA